MSIKAFITGCAGLELSEAEVRFFRDEQPWGFIIFARNVDNRQQVRRLTNQMRECVGRENAPVLIDEEGGRVQRLRPPHWCSNPPARVLGQLFEHDHHAGRRAAWLMSRLIAHDLLEIGVNVDCLPVLDVPVAGSHDAIGDRAYSADPDVVIEIGATAVDGLASGGVLAVVKHMPGQGRSVCDSHHELPRVAASLETLLATDFKPFTAMNKVAMAMSAHIVFEAVDPRHPATTSITLVDKIIRGHIGFDGLLMSDDVSMSALSGDYRQRTQSIFAAGLDIVLHCNGVMEEMNDVAAATPELSGKALQRANIALSGLKPGLKPAGGEEIAAWRQEFDSLVSADEPIQLSAN